MIFRSEPMRVLLFLICLAAVAAAIIHDLIAIGFF
jgi:hypothetical protein